MEEAKEARAAEIKRFLTEYPQKIEVRQAYQRAVVSAVIMSMIAGAETSFCTALVEMTVILPLFILIINALSTFIVYDLCLIFAIKYPVLLMLLNDKDINERLKLDDTKFRRIGSVAKNFIAEYVKYSMFAILLIVLSVMIIGIKPIPLEISASSWIDVCTFGLICFPMAMMLINSLGGAVHLLLLQLHEKVFENIGQSEK